VIIDGKSYHPTFLYESIWCLLLFAALLLVDNHRKFEGQTFLLYCIFYSFERFFVEWLRTDSLMLGALKQAQILSIVVFVAAIIAYVYLDRKRKANPTTLGEDSAAADADVSSDVDMSDVEALGESASSKADTDGEESAE
jgi:prolipoprotein diacylglyceryltransferase